MNAKNAAGLKAMPQIDGGLIGGASLVAGRFCKGRFELIKHAMQKKADRKSGCRLHCER